MYKSILFLFVFTLFVSGYGCVRISHDLPDDNLQVLQEKSFPIAQDKLFRLETTSGLIEVSSWDKNEVYIKILGNNQAKEKIEFAFNNNNDVIEVTAKRKSFFSFSFKNLQMKFEVMVPRNFNTNMKTAGGDIRIEDLKGKQQLRTSGGNISARNLDGNFDAETSGGEFKLENISGLIKIGTSGGDIDIRDFKGDLDASTSGGNMRMVGSDGKVSAHTSGGSIDLTYTGENKGIDVSSSGGDIRVFLPSDFNASAKLRTSGGEITSEFKGNNAVKISSSKFEADINKGGSPLVVETSGGDIELKRK